jgi:signal transduction histidine kinase
MHHAELLGALSITKKRGDAFTPTEDTLVSDLATQAGLMLRNVGLTEQLIARLAELRTSRERLVTAQDRERQRLERDIRGGAQRQLAGLASKLELAAQALEHDEAQAKALLNQVTSHTAQALKDLRELARGIYPALLADMGIAAALDAQARKAPIPVSVEAGGIGRYPQETEAAVYFCALEALRNAAKHAHASRASVRLSESNAELQFEVADNGQGFDPATTQQGTGLQGIADRIDALGGHVHIDSAPGQGTKINGQVPVLATT